MAVLDRLEHFLHRWVVTFSGLLLILVMFGTLWNTYELVNQRREESEQANRILCDGLADTRIVIHDILEIAGTTGGAFETDDPDLNAYLEHRARRSEELYRRVDERLAIPPPCEEYLDSAEEGR